MNPDVKSFRGSYLLYRKDGQGFRRPRASQGGRPPRFRHQSWDAAEAEAKRLLALYPQSTFLILQEVGRVKAGPVLADHPRIWVDPERQGGQPCIRGSRVPVAAVVEFATAGATANEIRRQFPLLTAADVDAGLAYDAALRRPNPETTNV